MIVGICGIRYYYQSRAAIFPNKKIEIYEKDRRKSEAKREKYRRRLFVSAFRDELCGDTLPKVTRNQGRFCFSSFL